MSAVPKRKLTAAEYLVIEKAAAFKSEFFNGEMFAMAGASGRHVDITANLTGELHTRLKGGPCRVRGNDQRVLVNRTGLYTYPDLLIVCGQPEYTDDEQTLTNPRVVVEVLSDSTERYDRTTKFDHYQQIPTVQEYVLVAQNEPMCERFTRQADGSWALVSFAGSEAVLSLASVPVQVPLSDVYAGVEFPPPPPASPAS